MSFTFELKEIDKTTDYHYILKVDGKKRTNEITIRFISGKLHKVYEPTMVLNVRDRYALSSEIFEQIKKIENNEVKSTKVIKKKAGIPGVT